MKAKEPKIVCFMCNWAFCQNAISVPTNVNVVRVMCVGRVDPVIVLETFEKGADAVMLVGCKPPDCHYVEGNIQAERTVKMLKKLLTLSGLENERLKLLWHSPTDERDFAYYLKEFSDSIEDFGLSPLKNKESSSGLLVNILAAKNAASDFRLRVLLGREKELTEGVNAYGERLSQEEFDFLVDEIAREEFIRHKIYLLTKTEPRSVRALAEAVEMKPAEVLKQIVNMRRKNMIALDRVEGTTPFYKALEVE
ncbi:MAG: hydrogenase iron-sulfur subunit [Candidatus Bathyarchaeia archaeon]